MKLKIEKILEAAEPYHGTSKTSGKPYVIYSYLCKGAIDGVANDAFRVKTMAEAQANAIQAGGEFDGEAQTYNGKTDYMVKGASSFGGGYKKSYQPRPEYSMAELDSLCMHGAAVIAQSLKIPGRTMTDWEKCDIIVRGMATYLIQACQSNVRAKPLKEKTAEQPAPQKPPIGTATEPMTLKPGEDPHAEIPDDEDVPF
jgi:hypothetical protein